MFAVEHNHPDSDFSASLPTDLIAYCRACISLCREVVALHDPSSPLHRDVAKRILDRFQTFLLCESPLQKLKEVDQMFALSRILIIGDDPRSRQIGHISEKLALGLKCFLAPNLDMSSPRTLASLYGDSELKMACEQATSAFYLAVENSAKECTRGLYWYAHTHIMGLSQQIMLLVDEGNFQEAYDKAQEGLRMSENNIGKYPLALKAHSFFSIVSYLLNNRIKGHLFGTARQSEIDTSPSTFN